MTNLTAPTPRQWRGLRETATLAAGAALFAGAAVEVNGSGQLVNLAGADTGFAGFLLQSATAQGDRVEYAHRTTLRLTVAKATNWSAADVQSIVYASDGNAFTLTSTSNQAIGKVIEIESGVGTTSAVVWVDVEGTGARSI